MKRSISNVIHSIDNDILEEHKNTPVKIQLALDRSGATDSDQELTSR
jgi:hypothetical protein